MLGMPTLLDIERSCVIARPIDVVRNHFVDFDHHIARRVHKGITYTVIERRGALQRVRQEFKVLGMPKRDEIEVGISPDGHVVQKFLRGDFAGGRLEIHFVADGDQRTKVTASLRAPLRGVNRLLAPIIRRVAGKLADQTIEEDRVDLEQYGYTPAAAGAR
jgi:hypothetical protein